MNNDTPPIALLSTAGGKIRCMRCQAISKRTKQQCGAPAMKGKRVCYTHGGRSTGPKTDKGKQRCAVAKTVHGRETRVIRKARQKKLAELRILEIEMKAMGLIVDSKVSH